MNIKSYLKFLKALRQGRAIITSQARSIFDVDYAGLKKDHDLVIFDYDDTLTNLHGQLSPEVVNKLKEIQKLGYKIGIVSNCRFRRFMRLKKDFDELGIYVSPNRDKPSPKGFHTVAKFFNIPLNRAVSIGDRIGTECFGSKLAGVRTIILIDKYSQVFGGRSSFFILRWLDALERNLYFNKHRS